MPVTRFAACTTRLMAAARPALLAGLIALAAPTATAAQETAGGPVRPVILMQVEDGDAPAADAATLLLQLRREMEMKLAA